MLRPCHCSGVVIWTEQIPTTICLAGCGAPEITSVAAYRSPSCTPRLSQIHFVQRAVALQTVIPGLRREEGLAHAGGDIVSDRNRLRQFMTTQHARASEIRQALTAGPSQGVHTLVQALSDQAGAVGAGVAETLADALDQALQAVCPSDFLCERASLLEAATRRLEAVFPAGLAEDGGDTANEPTDG